MNNEKQFFAQFKFDNSRIGFIGVEREQFVLDGHSGRIVPLSFKYLNRIESLNGEIDHEWLNFGYELSACQLESKIGPCTLGTIENRLVECETLLEKIDLELGMRRQHIELAPEDMPLDIYPDPTGRYQIITKNMPQEILSAACRVAATHIHIGMPNLEVAIEVYNRAIAHVDDLIKRGDHSFGKRMALYQTMATRYIPQPITSPADFYQQATAHGFQQDPRSCWTIVRISKHGTVEFRMFGATDSVKEVVGWVEQCHKICF